MVKTAIVAVSIIANCLLSIANCFSQSPQSFKYQAIARDNTGNVLQNQSISIRITILSGSPTGTPEYAETHSDTTNQFGLFTLQIGNGTVVSGDFTTINWGANTHYAKVEMDETGGPAYQLMGTSQLLSVPYALLAENVTNDNVNDADADPTNELQAISISNDTIYLSNGGFVILPVDQTADADADSTNELQALSFSNDTLFLSDGNYVVMPYDSAIWTKAGDTIYYNIGNVGIGTTIPGAKLEVAGQIKITGGTPAVGEVLTSDGTGLATWEPPTGGADADWTISGDTIYHLTGNVGIGTTSPGAKLEVAGQVKITGGAPGTGKVLTSDAGGLAAWQTPAGGGGFSNMQVFTTSGTFTIPAGITKIMVEVHGGGGGGGSGNDTSDVGQGGSGGGYGKGIFTVTPAAVHTVTVGAGGTGAGTASSCLVGGVGGTSSFGALISATGGGGGGGCGNSSTPGNSAAPLNADGQIGFQWYLYPTENFGGLSGNGSTIGMGGNGNAFFGRVGNDGNVVVYW